MRGTAHGPLAVAPSLLACLVCCAFVPGCSRSAKAPAASAAPSASPASSAAADLSRPLPSPLPDVAARVNGHAILLVQLLPQAKAELRRPSTLDGEPARAQALRRALQLYVERELLVQEALARGVEADDRQVAWAYDQLRREYADDAAWASHLAEDGTDAQTLRVELRVQRTITALLEREAAARGVTPEEARGRLLEKLRASARVELFL